MTDPLFAYGTLAPGLPNEHVLADVHGSWQPATVRGRLLRRANEILMAASSFFAAEPGRPGRW